MEYFIHLKIMAACKMGNKIIFLGGKYFISKKLNEIPAYLEKSYFRMSNI
jgi:hypothetical protein